LYQAPRGTSDIVPADQPYWRYVEATAEATCQLYGYQRLDTPLFEDAHLFVRSIGQGTDIVEKEMYTFKDRAGKDLTLRPEGTAPICRAYLEHGLFNAPQPVKLYYLSAIFRYERPQSGRYRQHHQFGFEALGDADPALDAEVIDLAWKFYRTLGLAELSLQLNSIGCKACRPAYLEKLKDHYAAYSSELCADCQARRQRNPLRLLDCKRPSCQEAASSAPKSEAYLCQGCREHFDQLKNYLRLLELPFHLNHRLVRGLDYYTRTVFEIQPKEEKAQSTIGGGGRYDDLIEDLGGRPTPAIGFATGIERIILNFKRQKIAAPDLHLPKTLIAYTGAALKDESFKLATQLRRIGIPVLSALGNKSLKAQLRQADTLGFDYTVIVAEAEWEKATIVLRDMKRAQQRVLSLDRLEEFLLQKERSHTEVNRI
jgi:histidyl-tRNA synthetase